MWGIALLEGLCNCLSSLLSSWIVTKIYRSLELGTHEILQESLGPSNYWQEAMEGFTPESSASWGIQNVSAWGC